MAVNFQYLRTKVNSVDFEADLQNYAYQNCTNPQKLRVFNPLSGRFEMREDMPCGKCWHCCQAKQAEWVTRMFLHNESWPYRYFVTLSYRPLYGYTNFEDLALDAEFEETLPLWDAHNKTHRYAKHPSVLSRNHLRNYFKRLRVLLDGQTISMFSVGEYGKKYSRPHYHLLIWSKSPIDMQLFKDAWSKKYCVFRGAVVPFRGQNSPLIKSVSFGDVDVVDLNKPRFRSKHGSTTSDVFKYVAKYVNKYTNYADFEKNNTQKNKNKIKLTKHLRLQKVLTNFAPQILKNRYLYEKKCISKFRIANVAFYQKCEPKKVFSNYQFVRTFSPFAVCSTKNAIGAEYLFSNFDCIAQGHFRAPQSIRDKSRFPKYYVRKINERLCPLRVARFVPRDDKMQISLSLSNYKNLLNVVSAPASQGDINACTAIDESLRSLSYYQSRKGAKNRYDVNCFLYDYETKKYLLYDPLLHSFATAHLLHRSLVVDGSCTFDSVRQKILNGYMYLFDKYQKQQQLFHVEHEAKKAVCASFGDRWNGLWLNAVQQLDYNLKVHQQLYELNRLNYTQNYE